MTTELIPLPQQKEIMIAGQSLPMAELFSRFIKATGQRSLHTARAYGQSVGIFLEWLGERTGEAIATPTKQGKKTVWEIRGDTEILRDITLAIIDDFSLWLNNRGNSQSTINQRLGAVNSFLRVALRDKVIDRDQAFDLDIKPYKAKQKRDTKPVGRRLSVAEVKALRAAVDKAGWAAVENGRSDNKAIRDQAILDLMLYAGLRREEVASLQIENITQDGGRWWLVLTGKGNKTRRLKIHDVLYKSILNCLTLTGRKLASGDNGPIFYNLRKSGQSTGKQLNASVIGRLVAEYGSAADLAPRHGENRLSPHDLRRTAARNAYDNGATIYQVQTMLGHADPKTTIQYIGALENDDDTAIDYVRY